jgi:Tfp pilus assembly protein PilN
MFSTIHISSTSVRLMTVKGNTVHRWTVSPLEPGLVRDGKIIDVKRVADVIDNLFRSVSAPKNNVIVTVSGLPYTYRTMEFPRMKPEQVEEAMNFNLPNDFNVPLENLYLSWAPINIKPDSVEYFIIAVDRQFVDTIIETLNIIGIADWSLDIRLLALARAAAQTDAVVVSLDHDYMEMVLVQGGKIKNMHSAHVDTDIDGSSRENYFNIFSREFSKLISYHHSQQNSDHQIGDMSIVLTGEVLADSLETIGAEELLKELRDATGYAVQLMETTVPYPQNFVPIAYGTNIGLALRKLKNKSGPNSAYYDIKLDLLQGKYDKKPQTLSIRYIILPALLVVTIGVAFAIISTDTQVKAGIADLEKELAYVNQNLEHIRSAEAEELEIKKKIDIVAASLQTSQSERSQLLGDKGQYASSLSRVTSSLPDQTDFQSISLENKMIRISGVANDPFNVIKYIRSLEKAGYARLNIEYIGNPNEENEEATYPFTIMINEPWH